MPKFFIPLGFRYGTGTSDRYSLFESKAVYGPYDNDDEVAKAIERLWAQGQRQNDGSLVFDGQIVNAR